MEKKLWLSFEYWLEMALIIWHKHIRGVNPLQSWVLHQNKFELTYLNLEPINFMIWTYKIPWTKKH